MKKALLAIDPQRDFSCPDGALYVPGADEDMKRLASFVNEHTEELDAIFVTLDSHRVMHIAHPAFWQDAEGRHPEPFTVITHEDARSGRWAPVLENTMVLPYLEELERRGKHHTIWPPHCIIDSPGQEVHPTLMSALKEYVSRGGHLVTVHKGDCMFAEHFSALRAEVDNPLFPETQLNTRLLKELSTYETLYLAGECADICVKETLRDILHFAPELARRITVLRDCMSALSPTFSFDTDHIYLSLPKKS